MIGADVTQIMIRFIEILIKFDTIVSMTLILSIQLKAYYESDLVYSVILNR